MELTNWGMERGAEEEVEQWREEGGIQTEDRRQRG